MRAIAAPLALLFLASPALAADVVIHNYSSRSVYVSLPQDDVDPAVLQPEDSARINVSKGHSIELYDAGRQGDSLKLTSPFFSAKVEGNAHQDMTVSGFRNDASVPIYLSVNGERPQELLPAKERQLAFPTSATVRFSTDRNTRNGAVVYSNEKPPAAGKTTVFHQLGNAITFAVEG